MKKTKLFLIIAILFAITIPLVSLAACDMCDGNGGGGNGEPRTPTYTIPTGLTATFGQSLSDVELPTGWAWTNPSMPVGQAGNHNFNARFTPASDKYYSVTRPVHIVVSAVFHGVFQVADVYLSNPFLNGRYNLTFDLRADGSFTLTGTRWNIFGSQWLPINQADGRWYHRRIDRVAIVRHTTWVGHEGWLGILHQGRLYMREARWEYNERQNEAVFDNMLLNLTTNSHFTLTRQGG